jgi:uncharacterized membrane protein YhiD involved in acid resistance
MIGVSTVQFCLRVWLAIGMGAIVGLERQWRQRMAGTRTNALVAAGAAAFVMCGLLLDNDPSARTDRLVCRFGSRFPRRGSDLQRWRERARA